MREIDSKNTATINHQTLQSLDIAGSRPHGSDNFGAIEVFYFVIFFHVSARHRERLLITTSNYAYFRHSSRFKRHCVVIRLHQSESGQFVS